MRSAFDFSSWETVLTTLPGLVVVSLLMVGIRLLVMHARPSGSPGGRSSAKGDAGARGGPGGGTRGAGTAGGGGAGMAVGGAGLGVTNAPEGPEH